MFIVGKKYNRARDIHDQFGEGLPVSQVCRRSQRRYWRGTNSER